MKRIAVGTSAALLMCMAAGQASAQISPIGPFTGPYTESFGTQTSPPFVQCINGRIFNSTADLCTFPGAGTLITSGWHRLDAGQAACEVELYPTAYELPAGNRLRWTIAGSDFHAPDRPGRWVGAVTTSEADLIRLRQNRPIPVPA